MLAIVKWIHRILGLPTYSTENESDISLSKSGGIAPSQPFHQLDSAVWSERTNRLMPGKTGALSYFKPNDRLGLDLRDVENSMILGRTLIIDYTTSCMSILKEGHCEKGLPIWQIKLGNQPSRLIPMVAFWWYLEKG